MFVRSVHQFYVLVRSSPSKSSLLNEKIICGQCDQDNARMVNSEFLTVANETGEELKQCSLSISEMCRMRRILLYELLRLFSSSWCSETAPVPPVISKESIDCSAGGEKKERAQESQLPSTE